MLPKEDPRGREHKRTPENDGYRCWNATSHSRFLSGFPWVGGRMSRRWSLIGTTQVDILFRFVYFLFTRYRIQRPLHKSYGITLKCATLEREKSRPVNSTSRLKVAAIGMSFWRGRNVTISKDDNNYFKESRWLLHKNNDARVLAAETELTFLLKSLIC